MQQKSIVPTHLPYVVSLVRFYETDSAIYLQLQHAAGGRLWSYVGAYLNQCADSAANPYCNVEPHRPVYDVASAKKDRLKNDRIGSGIPRKCAEDDLGQMPTSADGVTASASIVCTESDNYNRDLKSKPSSDLGSLDESHEPVDRKVSVASSAECWSQGFSEVLLSANPELEYFHIGSSDSSGHTSRQVSCSSAEDNFCRVHCTAMLSGVCRFCSDANTPQPASFSDNGTNNLDETSIYDGKTVDKDKQVLDDVGSTCYHGSNLTEEATDRVPRMEVDQSRYSVIRPNSQEQSYDSSGRRRRRRTLSSAFGELDLAESVAASSTTPPRPLVHLPDSCVRQWAAEMVVAISRLHSIGIVCRQVDLTHRHFDFSHKHLTCVVINRTNFLLYL